MFTNLLVQEFLQKFILLRIKLVREDNFILLSLLH